MSRLKNLRVRTLLRTEDWARTHGLSRWPAFVKLMGGLLSGGIGLPDNIARYLVSSHPSRLQKPLAHRALADSRKMLASISATSEPTIIARSIVVKSPASTGERGMLIVSFESELEKLAKCQRFAEIEQQYQIVFLPTWQPSYSYALFLLAARAKLPYYLMPASPDDMQLNSVLGRLCVSLPFQASSWVESVPFATQVTKDIDILVLANFSKYKRHWRLFEGLRDVPPSLRIVLAGRPWGGRTAKTLKLEAAAFGVADRIEVIQDATDNEIATLLRRARLFCAMSHKEGSYIAIAEALIAGTPVAMYANAIVGSKAFIQRETGFLLDPTKPLGPQITAALTQASSLDPATWATQEISAEASVRKLNQWMRAASTRGGEQWTKDVAAFHCRNFAFVYTKQEDAKLFENDYRVLTELGLRLAGFDTQVAST